MGLFIFKIINLIQKYLARIFYIERNVRVINTGKKLESFVQYVYTKLLSLNGYDDVIVSTNVSIKGLSGSTNEFDVFY